MKNSESEKLFEDYSSDYLVCDSLCPIITNSALREEALLYNLEAKQTAEVCKRFKSITDKAITLTSETGSLSGGQKVVLMVLLALFSTADKILFLNPAFSLDDERHQAIKTLVEEFRPLKSEIVIRGTL
jgi:ABC-type lipoprotein export system ATPase subunit